MKKLFLLLLPAMMSSCALKYTYYQVCQAKPVNAEKIETTTNGISYEDENCVIDYSFWAEKGNAGFAIYNKTNKTLCIDMNKSFFVRNGHAFNYEIAQKLSEDDMPEFSPVIAIPPKAYRIIQPRNIMEHLYVDNDLAPYPKESASISFHHYDSPLRFKNYLTYNLGEGTADIVVDNAFYISKVTNYAEPSFFRFKLREEKSGNSMSGSVKVYDKVIRVNTTDCFYLIYDTYSDRKLYKPVEGRLLIYDEYYHGYVERFYNEYESRKNKKNQL